MPGPTLPLILARTLSPMSFLARRTGSRAIPAHARPRAAASRSVSCQPDAPPQASLQGTIYAVIGTVFTAVTLHGSEPSYIARYAAICMAVSLGISVAFDLRRGLRNLQRADLFAILAYYFLTLFEFLFPQPRFDSMLRPGIGRGGVRVCLVGFAGLLIGRHLFRPKRQPFQATLTHEIPAGLAHHHLLDLLRRRLSEHAHGGELQRAGDAPLFHGAALLAAVEPREVSATGRR